MSIRGEGWPPRSWRHERITRPLKLAVSAGAGSAELVALEEDEGVVADLDEIPAPEPTGASGALAGLGAGDGGGVDVETVDVPEAVVSALAGRATGAQADFVDRGRLGEGGDEPDAALEADLVRVVAVKLEAAKFAGGWSLSCGTLRSDHGACTSVVKALPPERHLRGGPFC